MKFFKKTDILIITIILAISFSALLLYRNTISKTPAIAKIYYYSKVVMTIDLSEKKDYSFSIPQNKNVVFHVYKDGSMEFVESDCPDKICIKSGKLNSVGESAACLPNGIVVKIVSKKGNNDNDVDIVVGK